MYLCKVKNFCFFRSNFFQTVKMWKGNIKERQSETVKGFCKSKCGSARDTTLFLIGPTGGVQCPFKLKCWTTKNSMLLIESRWIFPEKWYALPSEKGTCMGENMLMQKTKLILHFLRHEKLSFYFSKNSPRDVSWGQIWYVFVQKLEV